MPLGLLGPNPAARPRSVGLGRMARLTAGPGDAAFAAVEARLPRMAQLMESSRGAGSRRAPPRRRAAEGAGGGGGAYSTEEEVFEVGKKKGGGKFGAQETDMCWFLSLRIRVGIVFV